MNTKPCKICEQGTATLRNEDGTMFLKCDTCQSEYADTYCVNENALSTRTCPKCKSDIMVPFHSTNEKMCADCGHTIPWPLTGDQKPVFNDAKRD